MTTQSTKKKTLQSFHARNGLWAAFVRHSEDMECSVDYLINEAMRMYSKEQGFLEPTGAGEKPNAPRKELAPTIRAKPSTKLPRPTGVRQGSSGGTKLPRPAGSKPSIPLRPSTPPPPKKPITGAAGEPARPTLTIIFQGRKVPIRQDQFIIGRGSKSADLPIKDANISRKHAAVIFHNGAYYMKDLGSTNGVDFNGKPIDSKRIDEGDVFTICGFDLHFTYNA